MTQTNGQMLTVANQVVINFFPANFSRNELQVWRGPYSDEGLLDLVGRYPQMGFVRDRDNGQRVHAWTCTSDGDFDENGFTQVDVAKSSHPTLFARIMMEGIDRPLKSIGFTRLPSKPFFYRYVNFSVGNMLADTQLKDDRGVGIHPKLILQSFITSFERDRPIIRLIVGVGYSFKLDVPLAELAEAGVDVRDIYVLLRVPDMTDSPLLEFNRRSIGRVRAVNCDTVELDDTRHPMLYQVPALWCFPEPNRRNFNLYLEHKDSSTYRELQKQVNSRFAHRISPKRQASLIDGFVKQRQSTDAAKPVTISEGLDVCFDFNYPVRPEREEFRLTPLEAASFSLDSASSTLRFTRRIMGLINTDHSTTSKWRNGRCASCSSALKGSRDRWSTG